MTNKTCSIENCGALPVARGWCQKHYQRWKAHADPFTVMKKQSSRGSVGRWLAEHVSHTGRLCLIWPFARLPDGRGFLKKGKITVMASRLMCEMAHGRPPTPKHEAAHSCGKGHDACVNPTHLRWATKAENNFDKVIHGTIAKGEMLPQAKLTTKDVLAIRRSSSRRILLARRYGVSRSCIGKIITRLNWRHVR